MEHGWVSDIDMVGVTEQIQEKESVLTGQLSGAELLIGGRWN